MSPKFRARKRWNVGPTWLRYFRNYSMAASTDGVRAGFTSHGVRVHIPLVGPVTKNFTTGIVTWDSPGVGSVTFGGRRRGRS